MPQWDGGVKEIIFDECFVVTDLVDVPSFGLFVVQKILQGGAKDLARSMTYTFASFGMQRGGASGGINALPDEKEEAIESFVSELADDVASGILGLDAGKGIVPSSFGKLVEVDTRSDLRFFEQSSDKLETFLAALGPVVVAEQLSGLDGKKVSIEGFGGHGPAMMDLIDAGGKVVSPYSFRFYQQ